MQTSGSHSRMYSLQETVNEELLIAAKSRTNEVWVTLGARCIFFVVVLLEKNLDLNRKNNQKKHKYNTFMFLIFVVVFFKLYSRGGGQFFFSFSENRSRPKQQNAFFKCFFVFLVFFYEKRTKNPKKTRF